MARGSAPRFKVAILNLHRPETNFIGDGFPEAIACKLAALGCAVVVANGTLPDKGPRRKEADALLAAFIRDGGFNIVAILNAWDRNVVRLLRSILPEGARLVRVAPPGKCIPTTDFDHDLDEKGLMGLIDGQRGVRGRGDRSNAAAGVKEVTIGAADEFRPNRLTIAGPHSGCPYIADARHNPIFAGIALDTSSTRVTGCTFCCDNTGRYKRHPKKEVLNTWLAQLKEGRSKFPEVREYLLVDERPAPLLPDFFRAVAAKKGFGPIELLVKSRVDEFLKHADTSFAEAAGEASRSGSTLHLYLMGFENFDPFHLKLFNKGHSIEDNVAAIAKLRELERCYPGAFEFRRYRTHGFILFTPWTEPEHLLANARMMRSVNFGEIREGSLKTRLRLYPGNPLYELARRDGLLSDSFDSGLGDRAAEQGYNPSAPWRFRDRRTATICVVAARLSEIEPKVRECDLLEAAARFVMRWPGLCDTPDVAHLPLVTFLRAFVVGGRAGLFEVGGAEVSAFDPEIEGMAAGLRQACLKENVPASDGRKLIRAYRVMGFCAAIESRHGVDSSSSRHVPGTGFVRVAVATDRDSLKRFSELRSLEVSGDTRAVEAAGAMLGYPACCSAAFAAAGDSSDNDANERRPFQAAPGAILHPLMNRLGRIRLLSHHICRPDCKASVEMAEAILGIARRTAPGVVRGIRSILRTPVLFVDHRHRALLTGGWAGRRFRVKHFSPLGDIFTPHVDPGEIRWLEFDRQGLLARCRDGSVSRPVGSQTILAIPGGRSRASRRGGEGIPPCNPIVTPRETSHHPDLEGFRCAWLGGLGLPLAIEPGWSISALANGGAPNSIELVITGGRGKSVRVSVSPSRPFAPRYGNTKLLDLVYIPAHVKGSPDEITRLLESIKKLLEKFEERLLPSEVAGIFHLVV